MTVLVIVFMIYLTRYIMKHTNKNRTATSLALISIIIFQPTISFAKEDTISDLFNKIFSSKSSKANNSISTQIFRTDINSLNIGNLKDFKTSIQDILKNFLGEKIVNNFLVCGRSCPMSFINNYVIKKVRIEFI